MLRFFLIFSSLLGILQAFSQNHMLVHKERLDSLVLYHQHSCVNFTVPYWVMKFVYDSSHINTHVITAGYDEQNDEWLNNDSIIYTYINGKIVESHTYLWAKDSTNIIMPRIYTKSEFFYNNLDLLEKEIKYCSFNGLYPDSCYTDFYTYDSFGNVVLMQIKGWSGYHWYDYVKFEYIFDSLGQYKVMDRAYSSNNSYWNMYYYIEYFYDQAANTQIGNIYNKELPDLQWGLVHSYVKQYDVHSNVISALRLNKNYDTGQMYPNTKNEYIYDYNYEKNDLILPAFDIKFPFISDFPEFYHKITEAHILFPDSTQWYLHGKIIFYYSSHTDSFLLANNNYAIQVYPNPASEFIYISTNDSKNHSTLEIFNTFGTPIMTDSFKGSMQIPLYGLSKGIYFYKINNGKQTATGKFIVY